MAEDGRLTTALTNPGIIDRLDSDIGDYLSPFGIELERRGNDTATLTVPAPDDGPVATLVVDVHEEGLVQTVGPLIRTYLRLSPPSVPPCRLRAVVRCVFVIDALEKIERFGSEQRSNCLGDQESMSARRMRRHVHMIVRNSMGSALCLDAEIVLPRYWRRTTEARESGREVPLTRAAMDAAAGEGGDSYPSMRLVEWGSDGEDRSDATPAPLRVDVSTRMCTVRCQPRIFRMFAGTQQRDCGDSRENTTAIPFANDCVRKMPAVVACIEKPGNLHRLLMLCQDYAHTTTGTILSRLLVVVPDEGRIDEFEGALDHFQRTVLGPAADAAEGDTPLPRPTFAVEADAVRAATSLAAGRDDDRRGPVLVGIDLHPDAATLSCDRACPAADSMRNAGGIVFGYESSGVPPSLARAVGGWVQIPSRSSINVVASMSITFDALLHQPNSVDTT